MEPQQPAQPPSNPVPPKPLTSSDDIQVPAPQPVPPGGTPPMTQPTASDSPPVPPANSPHPNNRIPLIMVAVLFVLLILGGIAAYVLRPQTKAPTVTPTVMVEPITVSTDVPTPTIEPTKTPEETQIDQIDLGTSEADLKQIDQSIDQL